MNDDTSIGVASAIQEGVTPSVVDMTVEMEKQNSLEDTTVLESFPPLSTPVTTTASNAPGKSSYANVTGKPSGKKLNFHTLFTPEGNVIDMVVPVESIRTISERFANTVYGFFLGKRVAYPVVANYRLDAMLENGLRFICNNPPILRKWHLDENLLKEDVSTPLMLDSYTADMCMQSWGRCACCKVFGHVLEECLNNIGVGATKNLKKTSQTPKGILVGQKLGFKPKQMYQPILKKSTMNTSGKNMNNSESTKEVSKSNPFEVLTSIDDDVDLERQIFEGKLRFVDDDGNPLVPTGIVDSDSKVEVVFDETANLRISASGKEGRGKGYGTNSLLEQ
ncbi:hypothetical protein Tco_0242528 [Tanacetum coccineum]